MDSQEPWEQGRVGSRRLPAAVRKEREPANVVVLVSRRIAGGVRVFCQPAHDIVVVSLGQGSVCIAGGAINENPQCVDSEPNNEQQL